MRSNNTSGVMGVIYKSKANKWEARIAVGGETRYLGSFDTLEEASAARLAAEQERGFHPNHGKVMQ
jgi:hypothetical protein